MTPASRMGASVPEHPRVKADGTRGVLGLSRLRQPSPYGACAQGSPQAGTSEAQRTPCLLLLRNAIFILLKIKAMQKSTTKEVKYYSLSPTTQKQRWLILLNMTGLEG